MNHTQINPGTLRAYLDQQLDGAETGALEQHLKTCDLCRQQLATVRDRAASVRDCLDRLPDSPQEANTAAAWAAFQSKREAGREQRSWSMGRMLSLSGAGLGVMAVLLILTVPPVRVWAESLLAVFRVQRFTVLVIDPASLKNAGLENNHLFNQAIGRVLSDEMTVTQEPAKPQLMADAATASKAAGFALRLLADETPSALMLQGGAAMHMKLDRDRLQSILEEAGRSDLQIPAALDGATISVRVPAGVMAWYGNCGDVAAKPGHSPTPQGDGTCISLAQLPSPAVSVPREVNPAQIAQVALQFLGMNANDAASFTQTVDWTSTLVLPIVRGTSSYEQVHVNGNQAALLRPGRQKGAEFSLMWVDNGIVFALSGAGDDTTAINLASQLQ